MAVARARLALGAKREAYRAVQEARKGGGSRESLNILERDDVGFFPSYGA